MKKTTLYQDIFFDLDKTLWDFTTNTNETFNDIFSLFQLEKFNIKDSLTFQSVYNVHNNHLWDMYRQGMVSKEFLSVERFLLTLTDFGIEDKEFAKEIAKEYIRISPLKTKLIPFAIESLEYLYKKYNLHIITNGFNEVQFIKLHHSDLNKYFKTIITSEEAGCKKPDPYIFEYSLKKANAYAAESIMIGDDYSVDIEGAKKAGIDQIYYNPKPTSEQYEATYEVRSLIEILNIL